MKQDKTFCVYILANRSGSTFVGMTSDLHGRMIKHREGLIPGYTFDRNIKRLVYFEAVEDAHSAVTRAADQEVEAVTKDRTGRICESYMGGSLSGISGGYEFEDEICAG